MQFFLVTGKKKSLTITVKPWYLCTFLAFVVLAIFFIIANPANILVADANQNDGNASHAQIWIQEIASNQQKVRLAKENAEKDLDALAARLSKLQAHVMRLDALGSRLAAMANIDGIEFDISNVPGLGGVPGELHGSVEITDFLKDMEQLDMRMQDQWEKLTAMESMLIDRNLKSQTMPIGNPIADGWISSVFGMRTSPITGKMEFHNGVDYVSKSGAPVLAVASGIVTWSGSRSGYGNIVEISHGNGYQTRYAHNKKNLVHVGQKVDKGQKIALMGSTGRSTGPHVHLEVLHHGKFVDPKKYISLK